MTDNILKALARGEVPVALVEEELGYPHVPAAFINAIAEEGTKAEAVEWLQKLWNENCALRKALNGKDATS